jgi:hypothetical protein
MMNQVKKPGNPKHEFYRKSSKPRPDYRQAQHLTIKQNSDSISKDMLLFWGSATIPIVNAER